MSIEFNFSKARIFSNSQSYLEVKEYEREESCLDIVASTCANENIFAYQLSPLSVTYKPTGADFVKAYTIVNDSDAQMAIQILFLLRIIDNDENGYTEPASQFFSILPAKIEVGFYEDETCNNS